MATAASLSVLFVCTGNICRSPTAEGVFRAQVQQKGLGPHFRIDSAGTGGWHQGELPDPRAITTAKGRGVDLMSLRARQLGLQDYLDFDYLIAMDQTHLAHMQQQRPAASTARLSLLLSYAGGAADYDVPDPYYGTADDFEAVYDLIEAGACGLLDFFLREGRIG